MALTTKEIQNAYVAFFNRPADVAGLNYWSSYAGSSADLLNTFAQSKEYTDLFSGLNNTQIVNAVYQNLFGRAPEVDGLNYWVKQLDNKVVAIGNVADAINKGAQSTDKTIVDNKVTAATAFTTALDTTAEILAYASVNSTGLAAVKAWLATVTADAATLTAATGTGLTTVLGTVGSNVATKGETFTLTQGLDTITGTSGNDTINAYAFNSVTGEDKTTLQSVDTIDGGAGTDTLNIEVKDADADADAATADLNNTIQGTISNVEIINVNNTAAASAAAIDASTLGAAAQQIWQIGQEANVTKLAATTTAGFKDLAAAQTLNVAPADAAASATVAFNNIAEASTLNVTATVTGTLNAVTVSGTVKDTNANGAVANTNVAVTVGKDVESVSVNSAVATALTVSDGAGTKKVSSVDASASTGGIAYNAAATVATLKTGAGDDAATLNTIFTSTVKAATLTTGAGKDTLSVLVDNDTNDIVGATVTVDSGAGDDTINVNTTPSATTGTLTVSVSAGAGDDKVTLSDGIDSVATTDVIDGGEGTDTVVIAGKTLDAEDYILLRDVVKNFEAIDFTTSAATVDASRMATYKSFSFADAAGTITKVAADQALTTTIALTATAAGYVLDSDAVAGGNQTTYAGSLNVTAKAGVTVTANAETVNLTVTPVTDKDGVVDNTSVTLVGDAKVANVTLKATTDNAGTTTSTADDVLETSALVFTNAAANAALTTLTISGNGSATVTNADAKALVTVDASALNSVNIAGTAVTGLGYTSTNTKAETIKLGGGLDTVTLTGSTVLKSDIVTGLTLVDNAAVAGTQVDTTKSDDLTVKSNDGTATMGTFVKTTTTAATLDLALVDLAASAAGNKLVFQFGGDTYIYADVAANGAAGDNVVNDTDVLVKLTGTVDLDLLVSALG